MSDYEKIINVFADNLEKYISDGLVSLGYERIQSKIKVISIHINDDVYTVTIIIINPSNMIDILGSIGLTDQFKNYITNIFYDLNPDVSVELKIIGTEIILRFDLDVNVTLTDLPHELIKIMMKDLSYEEIINVCEADLRLKSICSDESFWKTKLLDKMSEENIRKIWKGTNKETYKYYDEIMNSKFASIHVVRLTDSSIDHSNPTLELMERYNLVIPSMVRHGDIILVKRSYGNWYSKIVNITDTKRKLEIKSIVGTLNTNFPYPKFRSDYWYVGGVNFIGATNGASYSQYRDYDQIRALHFDKKIVNNLEYYGLYTRISKKYGNKYKTIYAKFEYNGNTYVIFVEDPSLNELKLYKVPKKLDVYKSFIKVRHLDIQGEGLQRSTTSYFNLLRYFRLNVVKINNVKEGNYAKAVF